MRPRRIPPRSTAATFARRAVPGFVRNLAPKRGFGSGCFQPPDDQSTPGSGRPAFSLPAMRTLTKDPGPKGKGSWTSGTAAAGWRNRSAGVGADADVDADADAAGGRLAPCSKRAQSYPEPGPRGPAAYSAALIPPSAWGCRGRGLSVSLGPPR